MSKSKLNKKKLKFKMAVAFNLEDPPMDDGWFLGDPEGIWRSFREEGEKVDDLTLFGARMEKELLD